MSEPTPQQRRRYTWSDYQTWPDDERWEIIDGEAYFLGKFPRTAKELEEAERAAYSMSPSPTSRHQIISGELHRQMANLFKSKPCRVFHAAMDLRLSDKDVVQPDLMVVCDQNQIKRTHIEGAPTLVVEILSSTSTSRDRLLKLDLYASAGVKEYWIVTPWPSLVEVLVLEGTRYVVHKVYGKDQTLTSPTFPDLKIELKDVFDFPFEPGEEPPAVKEPPAPKYSAQPAAAR